MIFLGFLILLFPRPQSSIRRCPCSSWKGEQTEASPQRPQTPQEKKREELRGGEGWRQGIPYLRLESHSFKIIHVHTYNLASLFVHIYLQLALDIQSESVQVHSFNVYWINFWQYTLLQCKSWITLGWMLLIIIKINLILKLYNMHLAVLLQQYNFYFNSVWWFEMKGWR